MYNSIRSLPESNTLRHCLTQNMPTSIVFERNRLCANNYCSFKRRERRVRNHLSLNLLTSSLSLHSVAFCILCVVSFFNSDSGGWPLAFNICHHRLIQWHLLDCLMRRYPAKREHRRFVMRLKSVRFGQHWRDAWKFLHSAERDIARTESENHSFCLIFSEFSLDKSRTLKEIIHHKVTFFLPPSNRRNHLVNHLTHFITSPLPR